MLKYLRIAVTALSLTVCVLLVALWVRSYIYIDFVEKRSSSQLFQIHSQQGRLAIMQINPGRNTTPLGPTDSAAILDGASLGKAHISEPVNDSEVSRNGLGFGRFGKGISTTVLVPYWFPVLICAMLTMCLCAPWSKRFSLRTLLTATTLVAVALGIIVAAQL